MDRSERRRQRLAELLDLAQTYQSCTRKELAKSLKRDPTKLIPGSGVPKLDYVMDLAGVLDWPVGEVVAHLWGDETPGRPQPATPESDFDALDDAARAAHRTGAYRDMIDLARHGFRLAETPEQRARACNREAGGWDGLGRYQNVMKAIQLGLQQNPIAPDYRRMLQSNLANAYYCQWLLVEARAISSELIQSFATAPPTSDRDRKTEAFAHYVAGHTARRLLEREEPADAERAAAHLTRSRQLYETLADELGDPSLAGIANTCRGGELEVAVARGRLTARDAIEELVAGLDHVRDTADPLVGDRLECYGWWCIFGCNIALRSLTDERDLQQYMAVFTNKADEIAEQLDSWAMRERVFTMEHSRWRRAAAGGGFEMPRLIDDDDVRVIAGTMARFPSFRETGWEILKTAKVVRGS